MFGQTFDLSDFPRVFFLAMLEILLSADNAIILAMLSSALPYALRAKALYIGTLSAFFLRALALVAIATLIEYQWIQLFGAAYLLYLSLRYFARKKDRMLLLTGSQNFWKTVLLIELFDLAFALDSILAGVAFIRTNASLESKLWIIYVGGMLGLLGVRFAAHLFSEFIHRFPKFKTSAYLMIGWIGLKLGVTTLTAPPPSLEFVFWIGIVCFLLFGLISKPRRV